MGELPFALAPEAALAHGSGRRSGRWSRTARRGTYRGFGRHGAAVAGRARRPAACPCGPPARVHGVPGKIPGAVPLSPAGGLHGLAAGAARPRAGRHRACRPVRGLCTRYSLLPARYRPGAAAAVWPLHGRRRGRAPSAGAAGLRCTRRFVLAHALPADGPRAALAGARLCARAAAAGRAGEKPAVFRRLRSQCRIFVQRLHEPRPFPRSHGLPRRVSCLSDDGRVEPLGL